MKTRIFISVITLLLLSSCVNLRNHRDDRENDNNLITKNYDLSSFDAIDVSAAWDVVISQGPTQSVRVEASEKISEKLRVEVKGGKLILGIKERTSLFNIRGAQHYTAYVTVTDLKDLEVSGASTIDFETPIRHDGDVEIIVNGASEINSFKLACTRFIADLSGSSEADVRFLSPADIDVETSGASEILLRNVDAQKCTTEISGGSEMTLKGVSQELIVNCSGASSLDAEDLKAAIAKVDCSGASDAKVYVTSELIATASGASDITYRGNPTNVKKDKSRSSDIDAD